jgi:hypothetical protein
VSESAVIRTPGPRFPLLAAATALGATAALALPTGAADLEAELVRARELLRAAEARLDLERRVLPLAADSPAIERLLRATAAQAGIELASSDFRPGAPAPPLAGDRPSPLRLDRVALAGRAELAELRWWLEHVAAGSARAGDLETLAVAGGPDADYRFTAELVFPSWADTPEPPPPLRPAPGGDPRTALLRAEIASLEARRAELESKLALAESWRRRTEAGRSAAARAALAALDGLRATAVTRVRVAGDLRLDGALVGAAARARLADAVTAAGFELARLAQPDTGACRPFALRARLPGGPDAAGEDADFDPAAVALCARPATPARGRVAARGTGGLDLALREVEIADLLGVLHDLTGESFVLDAGLTGHLDVELAGASLEQTLAGLAAAGVVVGPPPLRRVAGAPVPPIAQEPTGEPISLAIHDADLHDLLCLFSDVTGLPIDVAPGLRSRATVFTRELPWDGVLEHLIAAAGLTYAVDDARLFVGGAEAVAARAGGARLDSCAVARARPARFADARPLLGELGASDLEPAGVARREGAWRAYVRGPWGRLLPLDAGAGLHDARVESVGPDGARFAADAP